MNVMSNYFVDPVEEILQYARVFCRSDLNGLIDQNLSNYIYPLGCYEIKS
nr:hypothetical protein CJLB15_00089 [Campylobacter phage CJLB-15]